MPVVQPQDVEKLIEALAPYGRVLILTHNNPDPDAIAAAAGLHFLIGRLARIPASICYAGFLTREENKEMVSRLRLPIQNVERMDLRRFRAAVLVDTQPGAGNNALSEGMAPVGVVDHHNLRRATLACPFRFVDAKAGATSTIVFEML